MYVPELTEPPNVDDLLDEFDYRWNHMETTDSDWLLLVCLYDKEVICHTIENGGCRHLVFTYIRVVKCCSTGVSSWTHPRVRSS
jgi:hypothetical protein